ncbi:MAG TPA: lytic murein transglycosylase [Candidatus Paceibacterota bacterium]
MFGTIRKSHIFIAAILAIGFFTASVTSSFAQDLTPEQEAKLRADLAAIEAEIKQQEAILTQKRTEGVSIERDVSILNAKIKSAQLKIRQHELVISNLGKDISVKNNTITALGTRIDNSRESLAQVIERTREIDNYSIAEAILSNQDISKFFIDLDSFASIQQSLKTHLDGIKDAKSQNETVKKDLDVKRNKEIDVKVNVERETNIIKQAEAEKKRLLNLNKNEQKNYQTNIASNNAKATAIRNQLFKLRDAGPIKFGDAVTYAKAAEARTGVRAAFVLAIIQQESNLGANVGRCYLTDAATGAGVAASTGKAFPNLMKASRDVQPFMKITADLGRDPYKTLVSCPLSVGYGGAMGPAQFIPSTWQIFAARIATALGKPASDPWNPQDAFMASSMYLGDLGAGAKTHTTERNAACRYYSGRSCSGSNTFYGDQVMARVNNIQNNIDILQGI